MSFRTGNAGGMMFFVMLLMWLVMFAIASVVGNLLVPYIVGEVFGDAAPWFGAPFVVRVIIGAIVAAPSIPIAILTFIVSLFGVLPLF